MLGTIVNAAAIVGGGVVGLLLKKGLPKRIGDAIMIALGLCTLYIAVTGLSKTDNTLLVIVSMALGTLLGEAVDLDKRLSNLGERIEKRFSKEQGETTLAEGFVSATLLFGVGAMAIVGALQSGLTGDHSTLFAKATIDCVAALIFASSLGVGVILSAVSILLYQGTITLCAQWISPFLSDTIVSQMTAVGCLVMIPLALNMMGITKIKVMNMVPAIFLPIILGHFM